MTYNAFNQLASKLCVQSLVNMKGINVIFNINIFIIIIRTIFLSFFLFHCNFFYLFFAIDVCIVMSYTIFFLCMHCVSDINNVMLILSLICIMFTVFVSIDILNLLSNYFCY